MACLAVAPGLAKGRLTSFGAARQMQQVEGAQAGLHRGLAVGRGPSRAQPAIGAWPEAQSALALLVEHEFVVDETALAAAPFGRFVLVDARPNRIDRIEVPSANILYDEKNLTT